MITWTWLRLQIKFPSANKAFSFLDNGLDVINILPQGNGYFISALICMWTFCEMDLCILTLGSNPEMVSKKQWRMSCSWFYNGKERGNKVRVKKPLDFLDIRKYVDWSIHVSGSIPAQFDGHYCRGFSKRVFSVYGFSLKRILRQECNGCPSLVSVRQLHDFKGRPRE